MNFRNTIFRNRIKIWFLHSTLVVIAFWILFMPTFVKFQKGGNNLFTITLNGQFVGTVASRNDAYEAYRTARKEISSSDDELTLAGADMTIDGSDKIFGAVNSIAEVTNSMVEVLSGSRKSTLNRAYSIKINEFSVNLASIDDVMALLETALSTYDTEDKYDVTLALDPTREVNVLTPVVLSKEEVKKEEEDAQTSMPGSGFSQMLTEAVKEATPLSYDKDFSDYELGLMSIDFADKVEIVESYLPDDEITSLSDAIDEVTKDKETNQIYEVQEGDVLGSIALKYDLTVADIVAMNGFLESENTTIRTGDELIVTVPEPELSVVYTVQEYYEEDYEAEVEYVYNDSWYTTQSKVLQEPSAGHAVSVEL